MIENTKTGTKEEPTPSSREVALATARHSLRIHRERWNNYQQTETYPGIETRILFHRQSIAFWEREILKLEAADE